MTNIAHMCCTSAVELQPQPNWSEDQLGGSKKSKKRSDEMQRLEICLTELILRAIIWTLSSVVWQEKYDKGGERDAAARSPGNQNCAPAGPPAVLHYDSNVVSYKSPKGESVLHHSPGP